jgi:hypothetical protein
MCVLKDVMDCNVIKVCKEMNEDKELDKSDTCSKSKHPELQQQRACQCVLLQTEVVCVLVCFYCSCLGGLHVINVSGKHDFKTILCPYNSQICIIWLTGTECLQ